ncbi:hypothetical protein PR048_009492 [Dryococelus australis]|uniref:Reverse transcriptase domain-containing protein n=1 Tax=Dryococelus australis TaxID=614101 RepID=A0ABQ9I0F3_9NEOP|nr:hypothetical protein PR048_009492 [Dryococelus australis]
MFKLCSPCCIPVIKHIINHYFQLSTFPTTWKQTKIIPLGKISHPTEFKHPCPFSILPVMSKIIEGIECWYTSGFRLYHSTYTALLVTADFIYKSMDEGKVMFAIFLDFTKAFDTINLKKLLGFQMTPADSLRTTLKTAHSSLKYKRIREDHISIGSQYKRSSTGLNSLPIIILTLHHPACAASNMLNAIST